VAEFTEELAHRQARKADETLATGEARSILHGIPFGVKDLLAVKGYPTRWGSPGHEHQTFDYTASSVEKLFEAGGVLISKLEMIELAGGGNYDIAGASRGGACLSAWDKDRWAGGSSSGSGAATALACVGYSLGSETSGSIVCPSAFNGATGFRPTYGRVSRHGAMALCWTLDKIGPIARSAEDCALVLAAIAGKDPQDPTTLPGKLRLSTRSKKPKLGLLPQAFEKNHATDCARAYQAAIQTFKKLGYEFVDVEWPAMPFDQAVGIIVAAEGASAHENFIRGPEFGKLADVHQIAGFSAALTVPAVDYLWALRLRQEAVRTLNLWDKCDAIFSPVFYHRAPLVSEPLEKGFEFMGGDDGPANLLGWPAMAFPIGFEEGCPLGGQIIGPALGEEVCFKAAYDFQQATDFHLQHPDSA
jgi:aspartyl-tRNA(Asn)/glutamyl-tRNA(Gln) amidotransferase subunit A